MNKRIAALTAFVGLCALFLSGCQSTDLMPKSPYFGVDHSGKHFVPAELHEQYQSD